MDNLSNGFHPFVFGMCLVGMHCKLLGLETPAQTQKDTEDTLFAPIKAGNCPSHKLGIDQYLIRRYSTYRSRPDNFYSHRPNIVQVGNLNKEVEHLSTDRTTRRTKSILQPNRLKDHNCTVSSLF